MGSPERFVPSLHACRVSNLDTAGVPIRVGRVPVARVTGGLCGGMVLDSLRTWKQGAPPSGRADLARIFAAQLRSFQLPSAPVQYLRLQRPGADRARTMVTERARRRIVRSLASGEPVPVALVSTLSRSPLALTAHHVVLAYDLLDDGDDGSVFAIYDPNYPKADDLMLLLSPHGNRHSRGRPVHAAFVLRAR